MANMSLQRNEMPTQEAAVRAHNFNEVALGYTEAMAREKCKEYGLLSPVYEISHRGGCWFCPNCKIPTLSRFRKVHPELWEELRKLSKTPNLCSYGFKYGKTVQEVDELLDWEDRQLTLF